MINNALAANSTDLLPEQIQIIQALHVHQEVVDGEKIRHADYG
jgi:hypothetical protein